jgi:hypothetical protein
MTKLIGILIVAVVVYGGWRFFLYWERVKEEKEAERQQVVATRNLEPSMLPGLPYELTSALEAAEKSGAAGLGQFLKQYGTNVLDPRKAWIELDYAVALSRQSPAEARRIFAGVKQRTPATSPVWPRIQQLAKTYE